MQVPSRGRNLVIASSQLILSAFLFFYTRAPVSLVSWNISQQAFNSSMILLLDALETGNLTHVRKVEQAYVVFRELQDNGVHQLASLAVEKLSWGLDRLRKNWEAFGTHRSPGRVDSERSAQDEADRITGTVHDTVMGNTGMLLLEEVGLQSYTSERFAPFTWAMTGSGSEATTPSQLEQEQESGFHDKSDRLNCMNLDSSNEMFPITNELQGDARSIDKPPMGRHGAPPLQGSYQPRSCATRPASPMSLAASTLQQDNSDGTIRIKYRRPPPDQSPHSQHREPQKLTPPSSIGKDRRSGYGTDKTDLVDPSQQWVQPASTPKQEQTFAAQLRHNSCPSLQQLATTPPLLRPTYSSPITSKLHASMSDEPYDVHTHWSANPAAPILDRLAPGMILSPLSDQGYVIPRFRHGTAPQQQMIYQYAVPAHTTDASDTGITETNVEQTTVNQWKRWVGSGAAG